ncbi:hypothetical protein HUJ04_008056 [Dendroctonus ponderosae]|nr:hypothetical protein HUJ04_008056 [Dendroctonus ponderosae]
MDKYGRRIVPVPPWIPVADQDIQSPLDIASITNSVEYPALFAKKSWTQGVPEKDTQVYWRPSETIGSAFTPQAQNLRIQDLPTKKRKDRPSPLGADGKLQYPPKKSRKELEEDERKQQLVQQKKEVLVPGIIDVEYLLSGQWHRDQKAKMEKREKEKAMRRKLNLLKWEGFPDESGKLAALQAILPKDPDEQKAYLYETIRKEMMPVNRSDIERIVYYLTEGIDPKDIPPYNQHLLDRAGLKIPEKYQILKCFKQMQSSHLSEVIKWYCIYMRYNMLFYVLHDPAEWKRLRLESSPKFFPVLMIRAPVTWHSQYCISRQYLERHYFNGNIIVRKIRDLWFERYNEMLILPLTTLVSQFALDPSDFEATVAKSCEASRNILVANWLPECADIFLEFKKNWWQYVPKKATDSCDLVDKFFRCVNMLLSKQLRSLVMRSLEAFKNLLVTFKQGNDYEGEYYDLALTNLPILNVEALPIVGTNQLVLNPPLNSVKEMLVRCLEKILEVNKGILKIENIMFPEKAHQQTYLYSVYENEEPVLRIFDEVSDAFDANLVGPEKYLVLYDKYAYILNGEAERELHEFFGIVPFPFLKVPKAKLFFWFVYFIAI